MPNTTERKNWVFTRSQDFEPGKTLSLGQILEDAFQPASALIPENQIPPPPGLTRDNVSKKNVKFQFQDKLSSSFEAYCEAKGAPIGANVHGSRTKESQASWQLDSLSSETFVPSLEYVKTALGSGDVGSKIQWWKARRRIFMVTGVRIAKGGSKNTSKEETKKFGGKIEADGEQENVPLKGGAEIEHEESSAQAEQAEEITDFIFAYRLNEITYRAWISHKPIAHGHTAGKDDGEQEEDYEDEDTLPGPDGYELTGLNEGPFDGDEGESRATD